MISNKATPSTEQLSTQKEQNFDYSILDYKTQIIVQQHTKEIKSLIRQTDQDIINIGQKLLEVKEQLGHGHFETWLISEFDWSESAARKFMKVASQFKSVKFTDLSEEQNFDYSILDYKTQIVVQQHTKEIKSLMRRTGQDIINIGQKLLEVKEQLGHGHFETWLISEFDWSESAARKFMKVARQFKSVNFTDLSIDASALYILAAPSTPEAVRQQVLKLAKQGETITHAKVKLIATQYKKSAKLEEACKSTITIPAEPSSAAQIMEVESTAIVEQFEDELAVKETESLADLQPNNHFHCIVPVTNRDDELLQESAEVESQSLFGIGHLVGVTDFEQQDYKWLGKVVEIKEASATDIEVIIKISLQPPTI